MTVEQYFPIFCMEFEKHYLVHFQFTTALNFPKLTKSALNKCYISWIFSKNIYTHTYMSLLHRRYNIQQQRRVRSYDDVLFVISGFWPIVACALVWRINKLTA